MAATAWSFYNSFREYIGNGQFDLDGTSVGFYLSLHTSAGSANVNNAALSTYASLASEVASATSKNFKVRLAYCFEKPGVLSNADDDSSVIKTIEPASYKKLLADKVIFEGMIPKMDNAFDALNKGVSEVCICDKNGLKTIGTEAYSGTVIKL